MAPTEPLRAAPVATCSSFYVILISISAVAVASSSFSSTHGDQKLSAYEVLKSYGFPVGLLPKGITGYELDRTTGEFLASLNETCSFKLQNKYRLKYEERIEGAIERERVKRLKGVSVKVLVVWLSIVEVVREGSELKFSVGIASAGFPVENFAERPQCGCGLECDDDGRAEEVQFSLAS